MRRRTQIIFTIFAAFTLVSAGALAVFALGSGSSQTYFIQTTLGGTDTSAQGGDLYYAQVPSANDILLASHGSTGFNPYFLSASGIPASITTADVTVLLYVYPNYGTTQSIYLDVCDETTNNCNSLTATASGVTVSGSSCATATPVEIDVTGPAVTFNQGDTLELFIVNDGSPGSFLVCTGGSNASYLTLNPLESSTTTVTSTVTQVSTATSTETDTVTSTTTATATVTQTNTVTETSTATITTTDLSTTTETDTSTYTTTLPVTTTTTETQTTTATSTQTVTSTATETQTATTTSTVTSTIPSITVTCAPTSVKQGKTTTCTATTMVGVRSPPPIVFAASGSGSFAKHEFCYLIFPGIQRCTVNYTPSTAGAQTITATYPGDTGGIPSGSATSTINVSLDPSSGVATATTLAAPLALLAGAVDFSSPAFAAGIVIVLFALGSGAAIMMERRGASRETQLL